MAPSNYIYDHEVTPLHPQLAITRLFRILPKNFTAEAGETRTVILPGKGDQHDLTATVPAGLNYDDAATFIALLERAVLENLSITWESYWWPKDPRITREMPVYLTIRRSQILRVLGISSSKESYDRIEASLERLNSIEIVEATQNIPKRYHLIRLLCGTKEKHLKIAIDAYSADAILKKIPNPKENHFVDPAEIRLLRSQTAKAIYFALIRMIRPGSKGRTTFSNLYREIYDEPTDRFRTQRLLATLHEFGLPGWTIEFENLTKKTIIRVGRPPLRESSSVNNWKCNKEDE